MELFNKRLEEIRALLLKYYFFYGFLSFFVSILGMEEIDDAEIVEDEILINKDTFLSMDDDAAMVLICRMMDKLFEYEEEDGPGDLMYAIPCVISKTREMERIGSSVTGKEAGNIPGWARIHMDEIEKKSKLDWKRILHEFIQDCDMDYSFSPPDRRFSESEFFLPDYHEENLQKKKILFMIDTSGSMSDENIHAAFIEVKSAVEQVGSKLSGLLGFFDADVIAPVEFASIDDLTKINAYGRGGTSFEPIFTYVKDNMSDDSPVSIVILTDGYAPFPDAAAAMDIPVLWLIVDTDVKPPWGRVARI